EAKRQEGQERLGQRAEAMTDHEGEEDEEILRPLVEAQGLEPETPRRRARRGVDRADAQLAALHRAPEPARRRDDLRLVRVAPPREVGMAVADVVETAAAEARREGALLARAGEVHCAVARENSGEYPHVGGDAIGHEVVGSGAEPDLTPG